MEMSVVGKEMVGTEEGFWMEVGHNEGKDGNLKYGKVLVTKDFTFHKMVFVMPGSPQPMEMDMNNRKAHHGDMEKEVEKWHSVGMETITVPAGTFSCEHWQEDDSQGDVGPVLRFLRWVWSSPSTTVEPWFEKIITNAQTHITGAPVKFDPQMMRQQLGKPKP